MRYSFWTGPSGVKEVAQKLMPHFANVLDGTEHVRPTRMIWHLGWMRRNGTGSAWNVNCFA